MLSFVLGLPGTGKTTELCRRMAKVAACGDRAVYLVPEQFSFEAERLVQRILGPSLALNVEVLSFTRLCDNIFRALGGLDSPAVTPAARYLLMSVAVDELRETLTLYRKSSVSPAFLSTMLAACSELKAAGVTPERLGTLSGQCGQEELTLKLGELSSLYGAYQALLESGYADPEDNLIKAAALLEQQDYFSGFTVFVDGFTTFMSAEFALLGHMIAQSPALHIALTCDGDIYAPDDGGLFAPVTAAAKRLRRIADKCGAGCKTPVVLGEGHRFRSKALLHLSQCFLQEQEAFEGDTANLRLYPAPEPYAEMQTVAAEIARLVREENYRYNEIAVVARDVQPYLRAASATFGRYGVPYFVDAPRDVEGEPLVGGVLAALEAVRSGFETGSMLALLKSPLLMVDETRAAMLENYCYIWGITGAMWTEDFVNNPRGLSGVMDESDTHALAAVNEARQQLVAPLLKLRESCDANPRQFAAGIYDFLGNIRAGENLTAYAQGLPPGERESFLDRSALLWDELMDILDVFGRVLGARTLRRTRLFELMRLALCTTQVAQPPQTLDEVLLGQADRIRPQDMRAVFVIGANEGIFPKAPQSGGVFTDMQREILENLGAKLAPPAHERVALENFFAYFALTLPSERLYVSWPTSDLRGAKRLESVIVTQLRSLFPTLADYAPDLLAFAAGEGALYGLLGEAYTRDDAAARAITGYFAQTNSVALTKMAHMARKPLHRLHDHSLARGLFGDTLRLSPSKIERYHRCAFSFFASDGLAVRQRRRAEFTPLEAGTVLHHMLLIMIRRHGAAALAAMAYDAMRAEIAAIIEEYLREKVEKPEALPARLRHLFGRLSGTAARLLAHMGKEFEQSGFAPERFEMPIRAGEEIEPLELVTPGGAKVYVEGVVDRVDVMRRAGRTYVRVVDYKTGAKSFRLSDILYGLNMQMLLYLETIASCESGELAGAIPAGVLYMPVRESFISAERDTADADVLRSHEKGWRMNGLLIDDEDALRGMEAELAGVFIPVKTGKDGAPDGKGTLTSLAQMGRLGAKAREMAVSMAHSLLEGEACALPAREDDALCCEYCDYRALCGFEQGDEIRKIAKIDHDKVLQMLEEEPEG